MDDPDLKQLFDKADIPPPDENRRKETLNLAQAAYEAEFEKNAKSSQGTGFLSRLISRQPNRERETMSYTQKKTIYGGLATACVALLCYTVYPLIQRDLISTGQTAMTPQTVNAIQYKTDGGQPLSPTMKRMIADANDLNQTGHAGGSFAPQSAIINDRAAAAPPVAPSGRMAAAHWAIRVMSCLKSGLIVLRRK